MKNNNMVLDNECMLEIIHHHFEIWYIYRERSHIKKSKMMESSWEV